MKYRRRSPDTRTPRALRSRTSRRAARCVPQRTPPRRHPGLRGKLPPLELVSGLALARRDAVVVVEPALPLQRGAGGHVNQAVPSPVHGLRDVEDVVRREVEELHEEGVLVTEKPEKSPRDEPGAERVHRHRAVRRGEAPLQFAREQHVAQLAVLVRLVRVVRRTVQHREIRAARLQTGQVTQPRAQTDVAPGDAGRAPRSPSRPRAGRCRRGCRLPAPAAAASAP